MITITPVPYNPAQMLLGANYHLVSDCACFAVNVMQNGPE